jgi:hypothetical protein
MNKYGGVTISDVLRVIFGPFVLLFAFTLLAFLALCEEIHSWFGGKRIEDWAPKRCKNCGYNYQDPKYCSVWGRTADEHEWI